MKYLKRYNQLLEMSKNKSLSNLTNEELKNYEYIIGDNILNESFSNILDRLKTIGKKTVLTATLMASLMSNPAFSKEYNKLSEPEKKEIQDLVVTDKDKVTQVNKVTPINEDILSVKLGDMFESGKYEIDESKVTNEIKKIEEYVKKHVGQKLVIKVSASESRVPNEGVNMKEGELAEERFNNTKKFLESKLKEKISFIKDTKIGGPKYMNDDPKAEKYKKHQYVNVTIGLDLWDFDHNFVGKQANEANDFIGKSYKFLTEGMNGTGSLNLSPGRIPDRAKIFVNGIEVGDTGYFADIKPETGYKLVPLYVLELTKGFENYPDAEAFKGVTTVKVSSTKELESHIFEKGKPDSKANRSELEIAYNALEAHVKEQIKTKGYATIVIYSDKKNEVKINVTGEDTLELVVYSPIGKTGFLVSVKMDGEREIKTQRDYNQEYVNSDKAKTQDNIKLVDKEGRESIYKNKI